ncbi:MAG: lipid-A-disaccharide synthase-related protein [bacterium]|nr:lipid-A-disaccharide synthase-related protein [bacterium]
MTRRVLFISNGIGEDLIAAAIGGRLQVAGADVTGYPLVGTGAYPPEVPLLDPRRTMPSGGFSMRSGLRGLGADLAAGLIGLWLGQRRTLAAQRGRHDLVVAVGDAYCLWMASGASRQVAFVSTADSVRICEFGTLATWVMRGRASRIFARDPDTAEALAAMGLQSVALGNVMMDLVEGAGETFGLSPDTQVVALLPGSRADAPGNAALLAQAAQAIAAEEPGVRFLLAVAPTVAVEDVLRHLPQEEPHEDGAAVGGVTVGGAHLVLTSAFADAVVRASVVIGMAGTANEQAVGLGRPVVAFPGPGTQFTPAFLQMQRRLLGEALIPTRNWHEAAAAAVRLLRDPDERGRRGAVGRARMGPPGGSARISAALLEMLDQRVR